ncbi:MAG: site-specific DNA-methyltransferase, partial [Alphaproteobacteria bacterium]|nr:site-specific DNA-methyltransferase [Alphaproteobacteria bacterium]
ESHDSSAFYARKMLNGKHAPQAKNAQQQEWNEPPKQNIIYCHDSRNMKHLPDKSVHLMITSPPYNVGKDYEADLTLEAYKVLLGDVMRETYRVLVEGGRACVNIANVGRTPYLPLHMHLIEIAQEIGFFMRGEIIWDKGASAGSSCAWGSWRSASNPVLRDVHEYILIFCKASFARRPVKENSIGRDDFLENTKSIWRFPTTTAKKANHPAPFPLELPKRLIELYSFVCDIILDPFMGSGTTARAAKDASRAYIGYEIDKAYVKAARTMLGEKPASKKRKATKSKPTKSGTRPSTSKKVVSLRQHTSAKQKRKATSGSNRKYKEKASAAIC